jgi:hypothetical protein
MSTVTDMDNGAISFAESYRSFPTRPVFDSDPHRLYNSVVDKIRPYQTDGIVQLCHSVEVIWERA